MKVFRIAVDRYCGICPMRELIHDRGSAFGAHRTDEKRDGMGSSEGLSRAMVPG